MKRSKLPVGVTLCTAQLCGDGEWRSDCVVTRYGNENKIHTCGKPIVGLIDAGFMRARMCLECLALFMTTSLQHGEVEENLELLRSEVGALSKPTDNVVAARTEDD